MFQNWCSLSFLHWRCDARILERRLPGELELDTFQRAGWIGLTPFRLSGLRALGLPPLPWLSTFPETNLRTYVRGPAGPGIWFFSLEAASALAVLGARLSYGLPYHRARMTVRKEGRHVEYRSARPDAIVSVRVHVGERLDQPDALTRFLTERYRLYARHLGRLVTAAVAHESWPLYDARLEACNQTLTRWARLPAEHAPELVHYSPGVHTRIGPPRSAAVAAPTAR
jgi:uncharacterized protein